MSNNRSPDNERKDLKKSTEDKDNKSPKSRKSTILHRGDSTTYLRQSAEVPNKNKLNPAVLTQKSHKGFIRDYIDKIRNKDSNSNPSVIYTLQNLNEMKSTKISPDLQSGIGLLKKFIKKMNLLKLSSETNYNVSEALVKAFGAEMVELKLTKKEIDFLCDGVQFTMERCLFSGDDVTTSSIEKLTPNNSPVLTLSDFKNLLSEIEKIRQNVYQQIADAGNSKVKESATNRLLLKANLGESHYSKAALEKKIKSETHAPSRYAYVLLAKLLDDFSISHIKNTNEDIQKLKAGIKDYCNELEKLAINQESKLFCQEGLYVMLGRLSNYGHMINHEDRIIEIDNFIYETINNTVVTKDENKSQVITQYIINPENDFANPLELKPGNFGVVYKYTVANKGLQRNLKQIGILDASSNNTIVVKQFKPSDTSEENKLQTAAFEKEGLINTILLRRQDKYDECPYGLAILVHDMEHNPMIISHYESLGKIDSFLFNYHKNLTATLLTPVALKDAGVLLIDLIHDLLNALKATQESGVFNGDYWPENVLIHPGKQRFCARVIDFGFGETFDPTDQDTVIISKATKANSRWSSIERQARQISAITELFSISMIILNAIALMGGMKTMSAAIMHLDYDKFKSNPATYNRNVLKTLFDHACEYFNTTQEQPLALCQLMLHLLYSIEPVLTWDYKNDGLKKDDTNTLGMKPSAVMKQAEQSLVRGLADTMDVLKSYDETEQRFTKPVYLKVMENEETNPIDDIKASFIAVPLNFNEPTYQPSAEDELAVIETTVNVYGDLAVTLESQEAKNQSFAEKNKRERLARITPWVPQERQNQTSVPAQMLPEDSSVEDKDMPDSFVDPGYNSNSYEKKDTSPTKKGISTTKKDTSPTKVADLTRTRSSTQIGFFSTDSNLQNFELTHQQTSEQGRNLAKISLKAARDASLSQTNLFFDSSSADKQDSMSENGVKTSPKKPGSNPDSPTKKGM